MEPACKNPNCRSEIYLTAHHLYPRNYRYLVDDKFVSPYAAQKTMLLCRKCHTLLHALKENYELAKYYNTEEKVVEFLDDVTKRLGWNQWTNSDGKVSISKHQLKRKLEIGA